MSELSEQDARLRILRHEFLPALQACMSVEQLPEVINRLMQCLDADGGVVWRVEDEGAVNQMTFGCVDLTWTEAHADDSAGAKVCRSGKSMCVADGQACYQAAETGLAVDQVAAVAVRGSRECAGSVELWWKADGGKPPSVIELLPELEEMVGQVLPLLLEHESERNKHIQAISRLMMLYDVGKVFHSTVDLTELAPIILTRVQGLLEAEAGALWLLDPVKKNLYCAAVEGPNHEAVASVGIWASDPGLGTSLSAGAPVALNDVEDPAWTSRWGSPIRSLAAIPLQHGGRFLGAIEAVRGPDAPYFSEEDLSLLTDISKQAATALRNAQRFEAERRVKELHALMEISKEITATLDLDRVLASTVNRITTVIPVDRCSISLLRKGRVELRAISGEMTVDRTKPAVTELETFHTWQAGFAGDVSAAQSEGGLVAEPAEASDRIASYFEKSDTKALTSLLLSDEEGLVGVLALESKDSEALTAGHKDLARIFANQVTSAIRNALLYQQVPLIGVLQPLVAKKAKFGALPAARRRLIIGSGAAALAFLIFFPWWSKPVGEARVLPQRILPVGTEVQGVVQHVLVNEGDRVASGQVLAELNPDEQWVAFEQARAQRDILSRHVLQLEAEGNLAAARTENARLEQADVEMELQRTRMVQTKIQSPIDGVVLTPHLDERVGQFLHHGDVFCQVADLNRAWVEVGVREQDVGAIRAGQQAWVKLNTYPARRFDGRVLRVSPQGREQSDERIFDVIVEVPNPDAALRAGMMGRGKILAERESIGYLLLRAPARWIWLKVWKWLP